MALIPAWLPALLVVLWAWVLRRRPQAAHNVRLRRSAIALVALRTGAEEFLDVVLVATLLGFLASVALSLLVGRRGS
jgi:hypothetical protein